MIVSKEFFVGFNMIDKNMAIKDSARLVLFGDIAGIHSNMVGDGFSKSYDRWVLLGYNVVVLNRPVHGQTITVKTWSVSYRGVQAVREFEVTSESGELLAYATSTWTLYNIQTKRLVKITDEKMEAYKSLPNKTNFGTETEKLIDPSNTGEEFNFVVDWRYIDLNNHMNNSYYLDVSSHILGDDFAYNAFSVLYKKEIVENTKIVVSKIKEDASMVVTIKDQENGMLYSIIKYYNKK